MHQPPTIPEGDEENEGVEQVREGTRFPQTCVQQPPPIHDTIATASDLQPREDEGVGYGQTPTLQNEMIAVSGDVPTESAQQAEYDQPSSVEKPIIDDEAKAGAPPATDAENEIQGQLDEGAALAGITEEEAATDESAVVPDGEQPLSTVAETPIPEGEESLLGTPRLAPTEDHVKVDETIRVAVSYKISKMNIMNDFIISRRHRKISVDQRNLAEFVLLKIHEKLHKCMELNNFFLIKILYF